MKYRVILWIEKEGVLVGRDTAKGSIRTDRYFTIPEEELEEKAIELVRDAVKSAKEKK